MIISAPNSVDILNIGCILNYNDKYLLVHSKIKNLWGNITGHFEDDDISITLGVRKIIIEKLGLNLEPSFFMVLYQKINEKNVAYYLFKYEFENDPSEIIKLNNKYDKFGFFTFEEVLKLKLFEDEDYILKLFKETKRKNGL